MYLVRRSGSHRWYVSATHTTASNLSATQLRFTATRAFPGVHTILYTGAHDGQWRAAVNIGVQRCDVAIVIPATVSFEGGTRNFRSARRSRQNVQVPTALRPHVARKGNEAAPAATIEAKVHTLLARSDVEAAIHGALVKPLTRLLATAVLTIVRNGTKATVPFSFRWLPFTHPLRQRR